MRSVDRIEHYLRQLGQPATALQIALACDLQSANVRNLLRNHPEIFRKTNIVSGDGRQRAVMWVLKKS